MLSAQARYYLRICTVHWILAGQSVENQRKLQKRQKTQHIKNNIMQRVMAVTKLGEDLELVKCELPVPKGDEVLIRTTFAGLCHSDLHQIDGYFDLGGDEKLNVGARKKLPFCVGHEIEGEVIAVGKNANITGTLKVGNTNKIIGKNSNNAHDIATHTKTQQTQPTNREMKISEVAKT